MCILIVLSLIPAFLAALSDSLLEVAPKLLQDIGNLQKNQISANIGRFFMLVIFLFLFPWTYIAILASGIPRIMANIRLRKISAPYADLNEKSDPVARKEILTLVKRIMPGAIYYCFSAQITIWLISLVGSTTCCGPGWRFRTPNNGPQPFFGNVLNAYIPAVCTITQ